MVFGSHHFVLFIFYFLPFLCNVYHLCRMLNLSFIIAVCICAISFINSAPSLGVECFSVPQSTICITFIRVSSFSHQLFLWRYGDQEMRRSKEYVVFLEHCGIFVDGSVCECLLPNNFKSGCGSNFQRFH